MAKQIPTRKRCAQKKMNNAITWMDAKIETEKVLTIISGDFQLRWTRWRVIIPIYQSEKSEAEFEFTTYLQILLKLKGNFSFFFFFFKISSPVTEDVSQTHALIIIINIIVTSKLQSNIHFLRLNARLNEHLSKFLWHHDQITYNPGHTCTLWQGWIMQICGDWHQGK